MTTNIRGLSVWLKRINEQEMPALAGVIKELTELTSRDDAQIGKITETILKDAAITAQVLRIANSVQFNPQGHSITTVSRAVIAIGFAQIKSICMTISLVDRLLANRQGDRLLESLANSIHAAVQAKYIATNLPSSEREEVFIAALLFHLAELAFLGMGGEQAAEYEQRLQSEDIAPDLLANEIMGCRFTTLTKELVKEWHIGRLLLAALDNKQPTFAVHAVVLADAVAQTMKLGMDSPQMRELISKIAKLTGKKADIVRQDLLDNANEAATVAATYGANQVCQFLPLNHECNDEVPLPGGDYHIKALAQLTDMALQGVSINSFLQAVVKTLHKSVVLPRVCIAVMDQSSKMIEARYVIGHAKWLSEFKFTVNEAGSDAFSHSLFKNEVVQVNQNSTVAFKNTIRPLEPSLNALIAPIQIGHRKMGIIYADQALHPISEAQFELFKLFAKQSVLMLHMVLSQHSSK